MDQARFSTPRLSLSLITEDDHEFAKSLFNSAGWLEFIGDRNIHSDEDAKNYIRKIKSTPDFFYWVVRQKETQEPVGIISILKRSYLDYFDIGFAFLPGFEGRGYAFEAASEVLAEAMKQDKYRILLATTLPSNFKSIKLLKKLGFEFEKEFENEHELLSLFKISRRIMAKIITMTLLYSNEMNSKQPAI